MSVRRVMGTETEYAVSRRGADRYNPVRLSFDVVAAAADPATSHIRWDYRGEDPVNDARGHRLPRAAARPDMLTDEPQLQIVNVIAPNGGRVYVDHAHPEYSSPETTDPFDAVRYDHAGDLIMAEAARRAGRDPAEVALCAACKTRTVEEVRYSAGLPIDLFGENHVQELVEKTDAGAYLGKPGHFIGHLQTNKVNKVVGRAALIQSVDSVRLLDKIEAAAARLGMVQEILIEINIGAEESKSGVGPEDLWPLLDAAAAKEHLRVRGLMAIPPADADETATRRFFAAMRELLAKAAARGYERAQMDVLSMGMSHDYAAAIEEGATIVRVGTAIYGARDYSKKA